MMTDRPLKTREAGLFSAGVAVFGFLFDLSQPLGIAGGIPFTVLPLLGLLARSAWLIGINAIAGVGLVLAGFLMSPAGAPAHVALINRGMSAALIVIIATISLRHLAIGERLKQSLEKQASCDPLTGLYNRRYVFSILKTALNRHRRYRESLSLILIDADHFKRVNDEFGHLAGDTALRTIAGICTAAVRETDVVGRFGGEEFIIVLPHTKARDAAVVAERIRTTVYETGAVFDERLIDLTLSLGVAEAGAGADNFDNLLNAADAALYAAKRAGRNQVAINDAQSQTTRLVDAA